MPTDETREDTGRPAGGPPDDGEREPLLRTDGGADVTLQDHEVPAGAVAVDVTCPHCGERPIETVAKGYRVTGLVLFMQRKTLRFVGCQHCIRRKLLGATMKNLVLGWWGIKSFVFNCFAIPWNLSRGFIARGPNEHLVEALEESGIPYEFIDDLAEFDPAAHHDDELYLDGMLRLAAATMMADGDADPEEVETVLEVTGEMFPDHDGGEVRDRLEGFVGTAADVGEVAAGLGTMLTDEGKQLALAFVLEVAAADDEVDDGEVEVFGEVAAGLGFSEDEVRELLQA